jgi:hypothetical protein
VAVLLAAGGRGSIVLAETKGETARAYRAVRYEVSWPERPAAAFDPIV